MKRGFGSLSGRALLATLCFSFLLSGQAFAADTLQLVSVTNDRWRSDLAIVATMNGTEVTVSDLLIAPRKLSKAGDADLVENFREWYGPRYDEDVEVVPVSIDRGSATIWTEATYRDNFGNYNTVVIPPMREPIAPDEGFFRFDAIANNAKRVTSLALIPSGEGSTRVTLRIYDGRGEDLGTETVDVSGFTFYQLQTTVAFGRLEIANTPLVIGCNGCRPVNVYAIAFVGRREGGSPRAELPYPAVYITAEDTF